MQAVDIPNTPQFQWVAAVAAKNDWRPVLQCVHVEPSALTATDGYRLRRCRLRTGLSEHLESTKGEPVNGLTFPSIKRLTPRGPHVTLLLPVPDLVELATEVIDTWKPLNKGRRDDRPTPMLGLHSERGWLVVPRRIARPSETAMQTLGTVRLPIRNPKGRKLRVWLDARYVADALSGGKTQIHADIWGDHEPIRFRQRDRYELVMPMYVREPA